MVSVCWLESRRVLALVLVSALTLLWTVWSLELGTPAWVPSVVTTTTTTNNNTNDNNNNNNNNNNNSVARATNTSDSWNIILEYLKSQDSKQGSRRNKVLLLSYSRQDLR